MVMSPKNGETYDLDGLCSVITRDDHFECTFHQVGKVQRFFEIRPTLTFADCTIRLDAWVNPNQDDLVQLVIS